MRVLGLDFGSKTCGVAISDPFGWTAQGVETIVRKEENKLRRTLARIDELVKEYGVETIVLGLPLNMDDTMGPRVEATLLFKEQVERRSGAARPKVSFTVGEEVVVLDGAFQGEHGIVEMVDTERGRLRVGVTMFGRSNPLDLSYAQVSLVPDDEKGKNL